MVAMDIEILTPSQARARQQAGATLVDVRDAHERMSGVAKDAVCMPCSELEAAPAALISDPGAQVVLICEVGARSLETARVLAGAGYHRVASVEGGTRRWRSEGLPMDHPAVDTDERDFNERYSRHLLLPEVGLAGQQRLAAAKVALIGAGGLGSPAAYYLAAAGIGRLAIADDDVVDRSNLQRQILHTEARIGMAKVESARVALSALNPRLDIHTFAHRVTSENVEDLIGDADVVLDGGDNFAVRYLLNDACVKLAKPLVYGAVHRFTGQLSVFDAGRHRGECPCYRCLFPEPPAPEDAPNCSEAGVLGVLPGVIGMLQATEVIKLIVGIGEPLRGRLLNFDALGMRFRETRLRADPACPVCAPGVPFPGYIDYAAFCSGN